MEVTWKGRGLGTPEKLHESEGEALIFVQDSGFELELDQEKIFIQILIKSQDLIWEVFRNQPIEDNMIFS